MALTEQEILANTLKSQAEGGSAMAGGLLGEGADVPSVLENNPAVRALLEESIAIQSGNFGSVATSKTAADATKANQAQLSNITNPQTETAVTTTTPAVTTTGTALDPAIQAELDARQTELDYYNSRIDALSTSADSLTQQYIDSVKASYASRMAQMEQINQSSLASQQLLGIRSGRQRYAAEVHTSILSAEEAAGVQRLTDLENQMNELIIEAQQANNAQQFELLDKKMSAYNELSNQKLSLLQNQQQLAIQQEQLLMQQAQETREQAKFEAEMAAEESFFSSSDMVSIMKDIPFGETFTITDPLSGAVYTLEGLSDVTEEKKQYMATDDFGNVRIVNFDPNANDGAGGITSISEAGDIGKSKTAASSIVIGDQQSGQLGDASAKLNASVGSDGYANTDTYKELRTSFATQNPGDVDMFDETFKHLLNPDDPGAQYMLKGEKSGLSEGDKTLLRSYGVDEDTITAAEAAGLTLKELIGE